MQIDLVISGGDKSVQGSSYIYITNHTTVTIMVSQKVGLICSLN